MDSIKGLIDLAASPPVAFTLSIVVFFTLFRSRWPWTRGGGLTMLGVGVAGLVFGLSDDELRRRVAEPDNLPIVGLVFVVGFFVWLAMSKAWANDEATERGDPTLEESERDDRVLTWPDLVFVELIAAILLTVALVVWSLLVPAPLEGPANPALAPNPSKAPWYFVGLQELLVYFDPWLAGVVIPGLIVFGLLAIPYMDRNPRGNGYYTFRERRPEILLFLFGFLVLWCQLIVVGTFVRGPNWSFYGPFESWEPARVAGTATISLSEALWVRLLGVGLPGSWLLRELPGLLVVGLWFVGLPVLALRSPWLREQRERLGRVRFHTVVFLVAVMGLLPLKMYARWLFHLQDIVHLPELLLSL